MFFEVALNFVNHGLQFVNSAKTSLEALAKSIEKKIEKRKKKFHKAKVDNQNLDIKYAVYNNEIPKVLETFFHDDGIKLNVKEIDKLSEHVLYSVPRKKKSLTVDQNNVLDQNRNALETSMNGNRMKTIRSISPSNERLFHFNVTICTTAFHADDDCVDRKLFTLDDIEINNVILPNNVDPETLNSSFGMTDLYFHCSVIKAEKEVCPLLNGNSFESSFMLLMWSVEQWLRYVVKLLRAEYNILQEYRTLHILTPVDDNEIVFEKLNHTIRDHVAVVFEWIIRYYAPLSSSELKTIVDYVKKGTSSNDPKFRMNLVTSRVFDDAMRDCRVHIFQLTYSYVYPRNCRMLIGIPVYKDGYINGKDRKQNW